LLPRFRQYPLFLFSGKSYLIPQDNRPKPKAHHSIGSNSMRIVLIIGPASFLRGRKDDVALQFSPSPHSLPSLSYFPFLVRGDGNRVFLIGPPRPFLRALPFCPQGRLNAPFLNDPFLFHYVRCPLPPFGAFKRFGCMERAWNLPPFPPSLVMSAARLLQICHGFVEAKHSL